MRIFQREGVGKCNFTKPGPKIFHVEPADLLEMPLEEWFQ
jgi:hypothetical protein